jgi:hypothetical protein
MKLTKLPRFERGLLAFLSHMHNMTQQLTILVLCNKPKEKIDASTIIDHIDAFENYSKNHIYHYSNIGVHPRKLDLNRFDIIVVHYSICLLGTFYLVDKTKKAIKKFKGLKILFIQDEYRRIDAFHREIINLEFDILYTCVPNAEIEKVYPSALFPTLRKINTLTGYVPANLLMENPPLLKDRSVDVGYRARKVPFWLGSLGAEKYKIADEFYAHTKCYKLISDISYKEKKRLYGCDWINFITSCKTMLGVESGSSVFDFSGEIEKKVEQYQLYHPSVSFETIHDLFLKNYEKKIILNQISPRCFEAIALKTVLILYEGSYSGILQPWQHYIPLKKDFSNIKTVVKFIKSVDQLQIISDRAYQEIALNPMYSYKNFINKFDEIVLSEFYLRKKNKIELNYTKDDFFKTINSFDFFEMFLKKIKIYIKFPFKLMPDIIKRPLRFLYFHFFT